jgi:hypothetical protein
MSVLFSHVNFSHLNSPDTMTGVSPLQVAIKTGNLRTVQVLSSAKASLGHLDNEANSIFHYAASTTKEIISVNTCRMGYLCCDGCVCFICQTTTQNLTMFYANECVCFSGIEALSFFGYILSEKQVLFTCLDDLFYKFFLFCFKLIIHIICLFVINHVCK